MTYSVTDQEILKLFPYPTFRKVQEKVILRMNAAFNSGIRCALLSLPTGTGKSAINITFCRTAKAFYTTPQNNLIDQIKGDKYISEYVTEIKGRPNYTCVKDYTGIATVDVGMCTQNKGYIPTHCDHIRECLYYSQKMRAVNSQIALTNPMYLMLEGKIEDPSPPRMGLRDVLVVDEGHFIDEVIVQVSAFEIKPWMLNYLRIPEIKTREQLKEFVVQALARAINLNGQLEAQFDLDGHVTIENVRVRNAYKDLIQKSEIFLNEDKEEWIWETKFATIQGKVMPYLHVTPLTAQLFGGLLWRKSTGITIVSSATLLNPRTFMIETGLNQNYNRDEILYLEGPCIFPKENRPVVDMTVGNLSYKNLEANLEKACIQLEYILAAEPGNVAVHIPSYELVDKIIAMMRHIGSKHISRFITHESTDRNDKMLEWTNNRGNVFFAVAFTEGYDWKGDICDAQVLFKVPYPNIKDKRIARMLELKRWNSYYTKTLTTVIQSYGRAIRSETDKKRFYVIDSSFWNLIKRNGNIVPEWFLEVLPKTAKV